MTSIMKTAMWVYPSTTVLFVAVFVSSCVQKQDAHSRSMDKAHPVSHAVLSSFNGAVNVDLGDKYITHSVFSVHTRADERSGGSVVTNWMNGLLVPLPATNHSGNIVLHFQTGGWKPGVSSRQSYGAMAVDGFDHILYGTRTPDHGIKWKEGGGIAFLDDFALLIPVPQQSFFYLRPQDRKSVV